MTGYSITKCLTFFLFSHLLLVVEEIQALEATPLSESR